MPERIILSIVLDKIYVDTPDSSGDQNDMYRIKNLYYPNIAEKI